jgi:myo-inositol-1(or 4)-monophosphatase
MSGLNDIHQFASNLAEKAGDLIVEMRASRQLNMNFKSGIELVTNADIAADQLISDAIRERFPEHRILAEESAPDIAAITDTSTPLWIIDPIDGTVNYAHYHPQVAISIAYAERGKVQVGVVYSPFQAEMFSAIRHQGAWMNDQPLQVSKTTELNKALIATGFPYDKSSVLPLLMRRMQGVLENCADVRRLGSAALDICWVAMGRLDAYYETVSPWDCAAAGLIAREAGAQCGHFLPIAEQMPEELSGENLLISSPALYPALQTILENA